MDNLLQYAYFDRHCASCGGSYHVTLYDILGEYEAKKEWHQGRVCTVCEGGKWSFTSKIPEGELRELAEAWHKVAQAAADAGFELHLGKV